MLPSVQCSIQHSVPSTQCLSTQYPVPSTQYSALLSVRLSVLHQNYREMAAKSGKQTCRLLAPSKTWLTIARRRGHEIRIEVILKQGCWAPGLYSSDRKAHYSCCPEDACHVTEGAGGWHVTADYCRDPFPDHGTAARAAHNDLATQAKGRISYHTHMSY